MSDKARSLSVFATYFVNSVSNLRYVSAILSFNPRLPEVLLGIVADGQPIFFRFERDFLSTGAGLPFSTGYDTIEKQQEVTP